jgi:hypothetical protein
MQKLWPKTVDVYRLNVSVLYPQWPNADQSRPKIQKLQPKTIDVYRLNLSVLYPQWPNADQSRPKIQKLQPKTMDVYRLNLSVLHPRCPNKQSKNIEVTVKNCNKDYRKSGTKEKKKVNGNNLRLENPFLSV